VVQAVDLFWPRAWSADTGIDGQTPVDLDWTKAALPSGYFIDRQTAVAADSCVWHTQFCMVMASV
jgi:hypothetical protein